jgi:hypothetical protein
VVFLDYLHRDVTDVHADDFGAFERSIEVKIGDVHCHETCISGGDDTVEENLGHEHVSSGSGNFTRIFDSIPTDD